MRHVHATQSQIAELSGYSQETVSQVLRGVGRASEATRERVLAVAAELGYRSNPLARAIRNRCFGAIGLLRCTEARYSYLPEDFLRGLDPVLGSEQLRLTLGYLSEHSPPGSSVVEYVEAVVKGLQVDGLLVSVTETAPPELIAAIQDCGLPAVWINAKLAAACVCPDEENTARALATFAAARGCLRLVFVEPAADHPGDPGPSPARHFSVSERRDGCLAGAAAAGLPAAAYRADQMTPELLLHCVADATSSRPCLLVAYGSCEVLPVLLAAQRAGLAGDDRLRVAYYSHGPFWVDEVDTCARLIRIPFAAMAGDAMQLLLRRMKADPAASAPPEQLSVPYDHGCFPDLFERRSYFLDANVQR